MSRSSAPRSSTRQAPFAHSPFLTCGDPTSADAEISGKPRKLSNKRNIRGHLRPDEGRSARYCKRRLSGGGAKLREIASNIGTPDIVQRVYQCVDARKRAHPLHVTKALGYTAIQSQKILATHPLDVRTPLVLADICLEFSWILADMCLEFPAIPLEPHPSHPPFLVALAAGPATEERSLKPPSVVGKNTRLRVPWRRH